MKREYSPRRDLMQVYRDALLVLKSAGWSFVANNSIEDLLVNLDQTISKRELYHTKKRELSSLEKEFRLSLQNISSSLRVVLAILDKQAQEKPELADSIKELKAKRRKSKLVTENTSNTNVTLE